MHVYVCLCVYFSNGSVMEELKALRLEITKINLLNHSHSSREGDLGSLILRSHF